MTKSIRFLLLCITTVAVLTGILAVGISPAFGQNENSVTSGRHRHPHNHYAELARVPEKARAKSNPLERDADAVAAGGKLFEQHCAECHGVKAEGTKRGPSLLKEQVQQAAPGAIFWILLNGVVRHGMPDWSKLPEPERWQIVTFLKSLRAPGVSHSSTALSCPSPLF